MWIQASRNSNGSIAESTDVCRIFTRDLKSFYRLAFLLTANHAKAEQCILAGLEEALKADGVHILWAESWSKRVLIKSAVLIMRKEPLQSEPPPKNWAQSKDEFANWPFKEVIDFPRLERFVFVLTVLEKMSDRDCSRLLGCAVSEIGSARIRAFEFLSAIKTAEEQLLAHRHRPSDLAPDIPSPETRDCFERTVTKCSENSL